MKTIRAHAQVQPRSMFIVSVLNDRIQWNLLNFYLTKLVNIASLITFSMERKSSNWVYFDIGHDCLSNFRLQIMQFTWSDQGTDIDQKAVCNFVQIHCLKRRKINFKNKRALARNAEQTKICLVHAYTIHVYTKYIPFV